MFFCFVLFCFGILLHFFFFLLLLSNFISYIYDYNYMPLKERMVSTEADRLGQVSVSNASRRRLAGSGT